VIPCDGVVVRVLSESNDGVVSVAVEAEGDIESAISRAGTIPLPPYFHGTLNTDDRYQTVFADRIGSSAAPTAALHFTDDLVARLKARGVGFATVELEIGLDTFRPMTSKLVDDHQIHSERIIIGATSAEQINTTKATGGRVVAVGTTVVRTLEAASDSSGFVAEFDGNTDLFIAPGYVFRTVDALVTNFHAPRTTLLVLVSTMLGERWKDVYTHALEHRYRFLSFGDAMWLEVPA
jgi:S-adenosylmethionine:tRNA ribosyltransferase-isomerase